MWVIYWTQEEGARPRIFLQTEERLDPWGDHSDACGYPTECEWMVPGTVEC